MEDLFEPVRKLMESQSERPRRSQGLIACYDDGVANGWSFSLGVWSRQPLCISKADLIKIKKYLDNGVEKKKSISYQTWVQGCSFFFTPGTLIHQGDGSANGTICSVQVEASSPAGRVRDTSGWKYDPGFISFSLYKPIGQVFSKVSEYETNQLEFINLLHHGEGYLSIGSFHRVEKL